jgi:hypothetical protein
MNHLSLSIVTAALLSGASGACGGATEARWDRASAESPAAGTTETAPATSGIPCPYLHGQANLTDYQLGVYASSAFSFRFASQDPTVTRNDFDVLYEGDMFLVNMVTDDRSFIVDLGAITLRETPATVDPGSFPLGNWGEHDAIGAQLEHTYFVRSVDGSGRHVAAFRVTGLEPGRRVSLEWVRSTDPDVMVFPQHCL